MTPDASQTTATLDVTALSLDPTSPDSHLNSAYCSSQTPAGNCYGSSMVPRSVEVDETISFVGIAFALAIGSAALTLVYLLLKTARRVRKPGEPGETDAKISARSERRLRGTSDIAVRSTSLKAEEDSRTSAFLNDAALQVSQGPFPQAEERSTPAEDLVTHGFWSLHEPDHSFVPASTPGHPDQSHPDAHSQIASISPPPSAVLHDRSSWGTDDSTDRRISASSSPSPSPNPPAPAPVQPDELGYVSDTTISTLPPSYRSRRSNPRPAHPKAGDRPRPRLRPRPLPSPPSAAENFPPLPTAFATLRSNNYGLHGPALGQATSTRRATSSHGDSDPDPDPARVAIADLSRAHTGQSRSRQERTRRKSMDGGVRLAGGPPCPDVRADEDHGGGGGGGGGDGDGGGVDQETRLNPP
ncbi:hypothetical protein BD414DRAFT_506634 [Trametes punicea]|nr:hypothetical protein BD414DRAFT_506634 [Trametes punicea]